MTKKLLSEVTDDELRRYARISHGLEVDGRFGREKVLNLLADAAGMDVNREDLMIVIHDDTPKAEVKQSEPGSYRRYDKDAEKWVECDKKDSGARLGAMINVSTEDREGGSRPFFASHDGVSILIPRGRTEWVPMEFVRILQDAVETVYDFDENGVIVGERDVQRFKFSMVA